MVLKFSIIVLKIVRSLQFTNINIKAWLKVKWSIEPWYWGVYWLASAESREPAGFGVLSQESLLLSQGSLLDQRKKDYRVSDISFVCGV